MDPRVRAELDTLLAMVTAWKDEKVRYITPEGGDDYLVADLSEEIVRDVYPYVRRMWECEYLTQEEMGEFLNRCHDIVASLIAQVNDSANSRSAAYRLFG